MRKRIISLLLVCLLDALEFGVSKLPDNEVVICYLEDWLGGVIPEEYRQAQGRILMQSGTK